MIKELGTYMNSVLLAGVFFHVISFIKNSVSLTENYCLDKSNFTAFFISREIGFAFVFVEGFFLKFYFYFCRF